jgi:hypothetical protein
MEEQRGFEDLEGIIIDDIVRKYSNDVNKRYKYYKNADYSSGY